MKYRQGGGGKLCSEKDHVILSSEKYQVYKLISCSPIPSRLRQSSFEGGERSLRSNLSLDLIQQVPFLLGSSFDPVDAAAVLPRISQFVLCLLASSFAVALISIFPRYRIDRCVYQGRITAAAFPFSWNPCEDTCRKYAPYRTIGRTSVFGG